MPGVTEIDSGLCGALVRAVLQADDLVTLRQLLLRELAHVLLRLATQRLDAFQTWRAN